MRSQMYCLEAAKASARSLVHSNGVVGLSRPGKVAWHCDLVHKPKPCPDVCDTGWGGEVGDGLRVLVS